MTEYTVRFKQEQSGWHWFASDQNGWSDSLWDAMNDAYRVLREDLNKNGGTLW